MNIILAELENLSLDDLTYLFEYLVELINERKGRQDAGRICNSKRF